MLRTAKGQNTAGRECRSKHSEESRNMYITDMMQPETERVAGKY